MKPRRSSLFRMREQSMDLNQGSSLYHRKVTNTKNPIVVKEKPQILEEHPVKDKSIPTIVMDICYSISFRHCLCTISAGELR